MPDAAQAPQQPWRTGWDAEHPLELEFGFVARETPWSASEIDGFECRELGLERASQGKLGAWHVRARAGDRGMPAAARAQHGDLHVIHVLAGHAVLEDASGRVALPTGACRTQSPFGPCRWLERSPDFEMFELLGPARPQAAGAKAEGPAAASLSLLAPESFVRGAGPRQYFEYRDLGTSAPTGRRMHIHIVRALAAMHEGTGWHNHTMRQLFWVLRGSAGIRVEGHPEIRRVDTHDAMCISAGQRHDVFDISADYAVIEVCIPTDYATQATEAPADAQAAAAGG